MSLKHLKLGFVVHLDLLWNLMTLVKLESVDLSGSAFSHQQLLNFFTALSPDSKLRVS